jgi:hypothetical protein
MTRLWALVALLGSSACVPVEPAPPTAFSESGGAQRGEARSFSYTTLDERVVTSGSYRGRMTVIALVATYDTASQAQARFVSSVYLRHAPRINALMLVLEPRENAPLADAFRSSLGLRYDVALADEDTIAGRGPFPGLHHVPSIVLLDRDGREVWRQLGLVDDQTLIEAIVTHQ